MASRSSSAESKKERKIAAYREFLDQLDEDDPIAHEPVFVISIAAELAGMHAQTLRQYDRLGMVVPSRQGGGQRRYSAADVFRLRRIQELSRAGVSLEGIRRVVELEKEVEELKDTVALLLDQVDLLHRRGPFSRTFTAGAGGDVTTDFAHAATTVNPQYTPTTSDGPAPIRDRVARTQYVRRLKSISAGTRTRHKVLTWRDQMGLRMLEAPGSTTQTD